MQCFLYEIIVGLHNNKYEKQKKRDNLLSDTVSVGHASFIWAEKQHIKIGFACISVEIATFSFFCATEKNEMDLN